MRRAISRDGLFGSRVSSLGCGHRRVSRTAVGATGVLLPDWGALATVGPEGTDFEEDGEEGKDEGQEDEGFIGLLLGAGQAGGRVGAAVVPVVILRGKDESREPEVREDDIDDQDKLAQGIGHERRDKGGQEEDNRHGRNDFPVDGVLAARSLVDEVGGDTHHDDCTGPLHEPSDQL